ncbi:MAG: UMP kinase [Lentisphaeraceae bacterium]|nr:UMP kinase [Lentisphaeraceae bacterium]
MQPKYKRILLKLSGEVLKGQSTACHDEAILADVAERLTGLVKLGVEVGVVLGGGNIFRGLSGVQSGTNRVIGDTMGMLATIINALAVQNALERAGTPAVVMTAQQMPQIATPFNVRKTLKLLSRGVVVIFAGGTGNPFFSTDSGAALRAAEIGADALLKATKVDGVYTADPKKDPTATRYERLSCEEALAKRLNVMDAAAFALCRDNAIPIVVFDFHAPDVLRRVACGEPGLGTVVADF